MVLVVMMTSKFLQKSTKRGIWHDKNPICRWQTRFKNFQVSKEMYYYYYYKVCVPTWVKCLSELRKVLCASTASLWQ